jgi:hypothetical protein
MIPSINKVHYESHKYINSSNAGSHNSSSTDSKTLGVNNIGIQSAAAQTTDIENSETNFIFKQKLKDNCSGFATCTNDATQTLTAVP